MSLPLRHLRHQGRVIASLGSVAFSSLWSSVAGKPSTPPTVPGPEHRRSLSAPPADLVRDFVRASGGDPAAWKDQVPPHFYPQWGFPLAVLAMKDLPYPLSRGLNAGSRIEVREPLPAGRPLQVVARLEEIDETERGVLVRTRITTGTVERTDSLVCDFLTYVPLRRGSAAKKAPETVPTEAREIDRWTVSATAGLEFALLTGDFNPIHWIPPAARMAGFPSVILHGFGTMARTVESLARHRFAGVGARLGSLDVRFTKPLVLPAETGVYVDEDCVFVGSAAGAPAVLVGTFSSREAAA